MATSVALALAVASAARGGIVVLDHGGVLVGDVARVDSEVVTLVVDGGRVTVPRARVRWVDPDRERLTDAYWERHGDAPLFDGYAPPPGPHFAWVLRGPGCALTLPRGWSGGVDRRGVLHFGGRVGGREVEVEVDASGGPGAPVVWTVRGEWAVRLPVLGRVTFEHASRS